MSEVERGAREISVVDRLDILDLYARQSQYVDSSDGDGWADTFTVDGVFRSPTYNLTARGRTELKEFAETSNNAALARGEQFRHVVSTVALTPVNAEQIDARAYLMIFATNGDGSRVDRCLVLVDSLSRVDAEWRFASRETFRDN